MGPKIKYPSLTPYIKYINPTTYYIIFPTRFTLKASTEGEAYQILIQYS